eukprot:5417484-Prymnesium_polylepis.1
MERDVSSKIAPPTLRRLAWFFEICFFAMAGFFGAGFFVAGLFLAGLLVAGIARYSRVQGWLRVRAHHHVARARSG